MIKSTALHEIIKQTNAESLNVVADNLFLLLGAKQYGLPGTMEKGTKAVKILRKMDS